MTLSNLVGYAIYGIGAGLVAVLDIAMTTAWKVVVVVWVLRYLGVQV